MMAPAAQRRPAPTRMGRRRRGERMPTGRVVCMRRFPLLRCARRRAVGRGRYRCRSDAEVRGRRRVGRMPTRSAAALNLPDDTRFSSATWAALACPFRTFSVAASQLLLHPEWSHTSAALWKPCAWSSNRAAMVRWFLTGTAGGVSDGRVDLLAYLITRSGFIGSGSADSAHAAAQATEMLSVSPVMMPSTTALGAPWLNARRRKSSRRCRVPRISSGRVDAAESA